MGKNGNRPATPAQIERIKASVKGALAQVYLNLMLDCAFRKALSVTDAVSVLSDQDKEYAKKIAETWGPVPVVPRFTEVTDG